jgi:glutathione S-transferase
MLEELGIEYQVKHYQRDKKTQLAPKSLFKVHPLGKSPVITDDSGKTEITVAESGAIIEYLASKYGKDMVPRKGTEAQRQYTYWLHFAEGSLMPQLLLKLIFDKIKTSPMPFFIRPIAKGIANKVLDDYVLPNVTNNMKFIEMHLGNNEWFAGEKMTGADIQMSFPLEAALTRMDSKDVPNIKAYVVKIHALEGYKKAIEVGGPYDYA